MRSFFPVFYPREIDVFMVRVWGTYPFFYPNSRSD